MAWIRCATFSFLVLTLAQQLNAQPATTSPSRTWELRDGQWQPVTIAPSAPTTQRVFSDPQLDQIERLVNRGRSSQATKQCVAWLKHNKGSPARDRALF